MNLASPPPLTRDQILSILSQRLPEFRTRFGVRRIGLFGSFARDEPSPTSDIDILVVIDNPTFRGFLKLKADLESAFERDVDLVTDEALKPRLRDDILGETIYAAEC